MNSPLAHVCILGALLFAGVLLRTRIGLLRQLFIPASLVAGILGLGLGTYGLKLIPADVLTTFASLPSMLIAIVFAPMLMGVKFPKLGDVVELAGPQLFFGYIGGFLLISVPLLLTGFVFAPGWGVNEMFGTLVEVGFVGGHGTAGGMGEVYADLDWSEGGALGLTTATVGLFVGILCGMTIINWEVRRGQGRYMPDTSAEVQTANPDIIPAALQKPGARITISKDVVEPLAFHFGLIAVAILIGVLLLYLLESATGLNIPLFPMAMIGGMLVQFILAKTPYDEAIDAGMLKLIQGLALELLIVAAISTIAIPTVIAYWLPLLLISLASAAVLIAHFYVLGPRLFKVDWFEQSILNFGTLAGVTAVGLMLLRTVDPDLKSVAAKAYALRAPFISPIAGGGLLTAAMPLLVSEFGAIPVGLGFLGAICILLGLARFLGILDAPSR